MNSAFPRILTLLRKERGISQKGGRLPLCSFPRPCCPIMRRGYGNADWILSSGPRISTGFPVITCSAHGGQIGRHDRRGRDSGKRSRRQGQPFPRQRTACPQ